MACIDVLKLADSLGVKTNEKFCSLMKKANICLLMVM